MMKRGESSKKAGSGLNRTWILVALLVLVILVQVFPEQSSIIKVTWLAVAGFAALLWAVPRYSAQFRKRKSDSALAAADEAEYRQYRDELDAIRGRFDAERDLDDPTSIAPEYRDALNALHDKHQAMLERKFGPR